LPRLSTFTASLLGDAYALSGRIAESVPLLDQAAAKLGTEGAGTEARIAIPLSEGYLMAGKHDEARQLAGLALDGSRQRGERGYEAQALRLLAEIAAREQRRDDSARALFSEAQALAMKLEMRPLEARCRLGIGKLLLETGKQREAGVVLSSAIAMLGAMDMRLWLPEAEAALAAAVAAPLQLKRLSPAA